jgi:hypothetical protein
LSQNSAKSKKFANTGISPCIWPYRAISIKMGE